MHYRDRLAQMPAGQDHNMQPMAPDPILEPLDADQRAAVQHGEGPAMVVAGPGSGKTRVIAHRAAWAVERLGADPRELLSLTFTNKAADEMRDRIGSLLRRGPAAAGGVTACTFHSLCARILRDRGHLLGYRRSYAIYDTADSLRVVRDVLADLGHDPKDWGSGRRVRNLLSSWKNDMITPEGAVAEAERAIDPDGCLAATAETYPEYQKRLFRSGAMDFDDLLLRTIDLMADHPDAARGIRSQYAHILADEYQDANLPQIELLRLLSGTSRSIFAVGDPDQSIYAFRGAMRGSVQEFGEAFGDHCVYVLARNYRSGQRLLDAVNRMIGNNSGRPPKTLASQTGQGPAPVARLVSSDRDETRAAVSELAACNAAEESGAALYRTAAQSRSLEEALVHEGIPYQIVGTRFYDRREVKDVMAFLRCAVMPDDDVAYKRTVNLPARGVGKKTVAAIDATAGRHSLSFDAAVRVELGGSAMRGAARRGLEEHRRVLENVRAVSAAGPGDMLRVAAEESGYLEWLTSDRTDESEERAGNVRELIGHAGSYSSAEEFLEHISLVSDVDEMSDGHHVMLMTLHASKGLEFDSVVITGMDEGLCPHAMASDDAADIEEERRLAYVGMTRARSRLLLLSSQRRYLHGRVHDNKPSRFLREAGLLTGVEHGARRQPGAPAWSRGPSFSRPAPRRVTS